MQSQTHCASVIQHYEIMSGSGMWRTRGKYVNFAERMSAKDLASLLEGKAICGNQCDSLLYFRGVIARAPGARSVNS